MIYEIEVLRERVKHRDLEIRELLIRIEDLEKYKILWEKLKEELRVTIIKIHAEYKIKIDNFEVIIRKLEKDIMDWEDRYK